MCGDFPKADHKDEVGKHFGISRAGMAVLSPPGETGGDERHLPVPPAEIKAVIPGVESLK